MLAYYNFDMTKIRVNWFNDHIWIQLAFHHFIVIANELTSGTYVLRQSRNAPKVVPLGDHLIGISWRRDDVVGGASVAN